MFARPLRHLRGLSLLAAEDYIQVGTPTDGRMHVMQL